MITVTATDSDSMDTLEYAINDGNHYIIIVTQWCHSVPLCCAGDSEGQFTVERLSGLISTGPVPLDREQQAQYTLTVTVTDSNLRTVSVASTIV